MQDHRSILLYWCKSSLMAGYSHKEFHVTLASWPHLTIVGAIMLPKKKKKNWNFNEKRGSNGGELLY